MNDASEPKGLFANYKMNQFFGGDVINCKKKKLPRNRQKKKELQYSNDEKENPLKNPIFYKRNLNVTDSDGQNSKESLLDIVKMNNHHRSFTGIYEVLPANKYSAKEDEPKTMQIKVIDVLYNSQVCSLVYMQDLTQLLGSERNESAFGSWKLAYEHTMQKLR